MHARRYQGAVRVSVSWAEMACARIGVVRAEVLAMRTMPVFRAKTYGRCFFRADRPVTRRSPSARNTVVSKREEWGGDEFGDRGYQFSPN
jgi:hypothetical protein